MLPVALAQRVYHIRPAFPHGPLFLGAVALGQVPFGVFQVNILQIERRHPLAAFEYKRLLKRQVARHLLVSVQRHGQRQIVLDELVLDHVQHQLRHADLEIGRNLGHIRVAQNDVQAAESVRIGVRLVARVKQRALVGGLEADQRLEKVRALRKLDRSPGRFCSRNRLCPPRRS